MADENRMITFEYAASTWDQFKKQTVPSTKECMTKQELIDYFNVDSTPLNSLGSNQLVRRDKFLGIIHSSNPIISFSKSYGFNDSALYRSTYAEATQQIFADFNGIQFFINKTETELRNLANGDSMTNNKLRFCLDDTNKTLPKKVRILYSPSVSESVSPKNYCISNGVVLGTGGKLVHGAKSPNSIEFGVVTDINLPNVITDGFLLDGFHLVLFYMVTNGSVTATNYVECQVQLLDEFNNVLPQKFIAGGGLPGKTTISLRLAKDT